MCYNRNVLLERGFMIRRARKTDKEEINKLYKDWNENYSTFCYFTSQKNFVIIAVYRGTQP